ncbi:RidA family protein [Nonomuraea sp. NPDC049269]|uniref:RidA family protein n=1 Tax=Nonomuraea sp. NPDC049269 TaxID=3364349 RepID=UPI00371A795B
MNRTPEDRIVELGLVLPDVVPPAGSFQPSVKSGPYVYTSGQLPIVNGKLVMTGKLGQTVTTQQAAELAAICALNALAAVRAEVRELSRVRRIVKVVGFVASVPDYSDQPAVVNGASDLLTEIFGRAGTHARSAIGVVALPRNAPVELELIAEIAD